MFVRCDCRYSGKLELAVAGGALEVDFGSIHLGEPYEMKFELRNDNPVAVPVLFHQVVDVS